MSSENQLFVAIAEIAGVFVGFGALISVTRRAEVDAAQLGQIRAAVTIGLIVIVAALVPVAVSAYGVAGHELWFVSSIVFLALVWAVIAFSLQTPENRQFVISQARGSPMVAAFFWILLEVPIQVPLLLTILGVRPDLEPAFYTTALVFNLFEAAFALAQFVYTQIKATVD